jgi:hypothetical protein
MSLCAMGVFFSAGELGDHRVGLPSGERLQQVIPAEHVGADRGAARSSQPGLVLREAVDRQHVMAGGVWPPDQR